MLTRSYKASKKSFINFCRNYSQKVKVKSLPKPSAIGRKYNDITIGVAKEEHILENSVSMFPREVEKLVKKGFKVNVEKDAGVSNFCANRFYELNGGRISERKEVYGSDIIFKTYPPSTEIIKLMKPGSILFSHYWDYKNDSIYKLKEKGITVFDANTISRSKGGDRSMLNSFDILNYNYNERMAVVAQILEQINRPLGEFSVAGVTKSSVKVMTLNSTSFTRSISVLLRDLGASVTDIEITDKNQELYNKRAKEFDVIILHNKEFTMEQFRMIKKDAFLFELHMEDETFFSKTFSGNKTEVEGRTVVGIDITKAIDNECRGRLFSADLFANVFSMAPKNGVFDIYNENVKKAIPHYDANFSDIKQFAEMFKRFPKDKSHRKFGIAMNTLTVAAVIGILYFLYRFILVLAKYALNSS